ncbi:MAG: DNA primase [Pelagibaca sp.]|nr:DNA primase [Pelagibaca sp.]
MIAQQFLDQVEAHTTMSALVSTRVKLTRNGREWKACCPVHNEKTPSFTVNDEKGFAHCFGCEFHAGPIRWLTEVEGLDFIDAVRKLAEDAGMAMPERSAASRAKAERVAGVRPALEAAQAVFAAQLGRVPSVQQYLQRRGVNQALAERFGIGMAPEGRGYLEKAGVGEADGLAAGLMWERDGRTGPRFFGRITVPVHDARGRIVGFGARATPDAPPDAAKYLNSPDSEIFDKGRLLFNLHRAAPAIRASKRALVVEGYFDVIGLAGAGVEEAVAPMGTALTEAQLTQLWRLTRSPVLMFDGDAAGRKAAWRACEKALPGIAPDRTLKVALLPKGQDPDDLARSQGTRGVEAAVEDALPLDAFLFGSVAEGIDAGSSPEDRAAVWGELAALVDKIEHDELRGEYLAAWRARYERLVSGKERAGRTEVLATTVEAEDGDYRWPESEDDSEKRLIAVVRQLLQLRAEERAAMEPIREERKFVRGLAKMAGLRLPQVDAVVKMIEMDMHEGSSAGRHESESVLVLYRRVLAVEGPLTEALLPVVVDGRSRPKAVTAGADAPPRAASALAWHDAGGV